MLSNAILAFKAIGSSVVLYTLEFTTAAQKSLSKLPGLIQHRIVDKLYTLRTQPRPPEAKKLQGKHGEIFRVRVGDYRILYQIEHERLVILVVQIGHRREVYR